MPNIGCSILYATGNGDFADDQKIDLKGLLISTLTDVGLGELLNTKKIGKIADDFSNNSKISSNRADDLAKRANPNKKLVEKAKSQAKSDKQASIAFKSVEAVAETTNNIVSDGSKKLVKEDVK